MARKGIDMAMDALLREHPDYVNDSDARYTPAEIDMALDMYLDNPSRLLTCFMASETVKLMEKRRMKRVSERTCIIMNADEAPDVGDTVELDGNIYKVIAVRSASNSNEVEVDVDPFTD